MWTRRSTAPVSEMRSLDRRSFLQGALAVAGWLALSFVPRRAEGTPAAVPLAPGLEEALARSHFVYVSPLLSDGSESRCHGEIWFAWLDGAVVAISARTTWRVRAIQRGLVRARIWVGDYGRWKTLFGHDEAFRAGPHFEAKGSLVRDSALLDRLMAAYRAKYGGEFSSWEPRMRQGYATGERVLIRYEALDAGHVPERGAAAPEVPARQGAGSSTAAPPVALQGADQERKMPIR